jgi:DNA-binding transcriptional regulator YbjK
MAKTKNAFHLASIGQSLSKSDLRRLTMIESAIKGMAEEGLEGANFERVARNLKIRRSHVTYYFKDRNELALAAINYVVTIAQDMTNKKIDDATNMKAKVLAINEVTFEWANKFKDHARSLIVFYSQCANNPSFKKFNTSFRKEGSQRILNIFKNYDVKGTDDELLVKAQTIQSIIMGFVIEHMASSAISNCKELSASQIQLVLA